MLKQKCENYFQNSNIENKNLMYECYNSYFKNLNTEKI